MGRNRHGRVASEKNKTLKISWGWKIWRSHQPQLAHLGLTKAATKEAHRDRTGSHRITAAASSPERLASRIHFPWLNCQKSGAGSSCPQRERVHACVCVCAGSESFTTRSSPGSEVVFARLYIFWTLYTAQSCQIWAFRGPKNKFGLS